MNLEEIRKFLKTESVELTGSRRICAESCSINSDYDYVCLVESVDVATRMAIEKDFTEDGSDFRSDKNFISLSRNETNLIITESKEFYDLFLLATRVATKLGLTAREHRVSLFQAILYKND